MHRARLILSFSVEWYTSSRKDQFLARAEASISQCHLVVVVQVPTFWSLPTLARSWSSLLDLAYRSGSYFPHYHLNRWELDSYDFSLVDF